MTGNQFIRKIGDKALGMIYPRVCPLCGEILTAGNVNRKRESVNSGNPYMCRECYRKLKYNIGRDARTRCRHCSRLLDEGEGDLCHFCASRNLYFDQGAALLIHDEAARKMIYGLKFYGKRDNADALAFEAAERFLGLVKAWQPQVIIPVPLHRKRLKERGFNQAALLSEKLSVFLKESGIFLPMDTDYLVRQKKTKFQKELSGEERSANIYEAFAVKKGKQDYKRILLIDDIVTSGSTLSECARILKKAGAEKVFFISMSIGTDANM